MSPEITTRRAIEVCMSRLRMNSDTRGDMAYHLRSTIDRGEQPVAPFDPDTVRAQIMCLVEDTMVDASYTRQQLLNRLTEIRTNLNSLLGDGK